MKLSDAANILNLSGKITHSDIKLAYKRACLKYHPDKGGSNEMMQCVNQAYSRLAEFDGQISPDNSNASYPDELNDAINAIINLKGINIEVCGAWLWVTGDTKQHSKLLGKKGAGLFYASKKKAWYFRPDDWKSTSRGSYSLNDIRAVHGSSKVETQKNKSIGIKQ